MVVLFALVSCVTSEPSCDADIEAWEDADGDGYGQKSLGFVCRLEDGQVDRPLDCDDTNPELNPEVAESCDGVDNDCDGRIDEDSGLRQFWQDTDGDGFGGLFPSQLACDKPEGWVANDEDCDDDDALVNPDAREVCGRVDEDCDGYLDESDDSVDPASFSTFFRDSDGDGYGDPAVTVDRCRLVTGWVLNADDCDDNTDAIGRIDWYADRDDDGFGDPTTLTWSCTRPAGGVRNDLDCDDQDDRYNVDVNWYEDLDDDGYGAGAPLAVQCAPPTPETVSASGDCDDLDAAFNPGAHDVCLDGTDLNCDGTDECRTCGEYLAADPTSASGVYTLDLPGGNFDVLCDMTTDGGGWTLVASSRFTPPSDMAGAWHTELDTVSPNNAHNIVWDGLRDVLPTASDIRFACKQIHIGAFDVDLSFYDIHWYHEITTGTDADSCFNEGNGAGYDSPPERRNNLTGDTRAAGDDWNQGFLEGEDTCSDSGDFAIDFDNLGHDSFLDGTDWGMSNWSDRCGSSFGGDSWFIFVRE